MNVPKLAFLLCRLQPLECSPLISVKLLLVMLIKINIMVCIMILHDVCERVTAPLPIVHRALFFFDYRYFHWDTQRELLRRRERPNCFADKQGFWCSSHGQVMWFSRIFACHLSVFLFLIIPHFFVPLVPLLSLFPFRK